MIFLRLISLVLIISVSSCYKSDWSAEARKLFENGSVTDIYDFSKRYKGFADKKGHTLAHIMVLSEGCRYAETLASVGYSLNDIDDDGDSPLSLAIIVREPACVKKILDHAINAEEAVNWISEEWGGDIDIVSLAIAHDLDRENFIRIINLKYKGELSEELIDGYLVDSVKSINADQVRYFFGFGRKSEFDVAG